MSSLRARLAAVLIAFAAIQAAPVCALPARHVAPKRVDPPLVDPPPAQDAAPPDDSLPSPDGAPADDSTTAPDVPSAEAPASAAARVIDWVVATHDNGAFPFVVVDKVGAELLVFDPTGKPIAQAPVLVGITRGDDSAPGVGDRELSHIPMSQRTTPAGRFMASFGPAAGHKEKVIWVDFPDAISLHAVVTNNPREHRLARLQSPTAADNRITFGCINVATKFYHNVIAPLFREAGGVVYILPETRPLNEVFAGMPPGDSEARLPFDDVFAGFQSGDAEQASGAE